MLGLSWNRTTSAAHFDAPGLHAHLGARHAGVAVGPVVLAHSAAYHVFADEHRWHRWYVWARCGPRRLELSINRPTLQRIP